MAGRQLIQIPPMSGGLNTENSLLADSPQTTVDEENFFISRQGARLKRYGLDYEPAYTFYPNALGNDFEDYAYSAYEWKRPGDYGKSLKVIQAGATLYFYEDGLRPFSSHYLLDTVDMTEFKVSDDFYKDPVSFTEAYGILYISGKHIDTFSVEYTSRALSEAKDAKAVLSMTPVTVKVNTPVVQGSAVTYPIIALNKAAYIKITYKGIQIYSYVPTSYALAAFNATVVANAWNAASSADRDRIIATVEDDNVIFTAPAGSGSDTNGGTILVEYRPFEATTVYDATFISAGFLNFLAWLSSSRQLGDKKSSPPSSFDSVLPFASALSEVNSKGAIVQRAAIMSGGTSAIESAGFYATKITPQIRDLTGLEDYTTIDEMPTTLTDLHKYNLRNQGWSDTEINSFHSSQSKYPSNNMQWFIGKDVNNSFSPTELLKIYFGTTPAPKGKYILNYYTKNRSEPSGIVNLPLSIQVLDRPVQSITYAGRLFMLCNQELLYSQVLADDKTKASKCYQDADPTSEEISDLVATDGGVIPLPAIGNGVGMAVIDTYLLVFGDKGVVAIYGDAAANFKATGHTVRQVSTESCFSKESIVSTDNGVFFWSSSGIQQITIENVSGVPIVQNISLQTIKSFINRIDAEKIKKVKGIYNKAQNRISWWYPSQDLKGLDSVLLLDLSRGIWYPWRISNTSDSPAVVTPLSISESFSIRPSSKIYVNSTQVRAGDSAVIIGDAEEDRQDLSNVIFLAVDRASKQFTFAEFYDKSFTDWMSSAGQAQPYKAYALSGAIVAEQTFRRKTLVYLEAIMRRTELKDMFKSSCMMSTRWNWHVNKDAFKWDSAQEIYRANKKDLASLKFVKSKTRVRGIGDALQLYIESPEGYDCRLEGFALDLEGI